jgi:hypothetical protein
MKTLMMMVLASSLLSVTGEVVDVHCYLSRGAHGDEHAGCANACLSRDVPAALLTEDGTLYLLLNEKAVSLKEKIAGKAGKKVTATGKVVERNGVKAIQVTTIE